MQTRGASFSPKDAAVPHSRRLTVARFADPKASFVAQFLSSSSRCMRGPISLPFNTLPCLNVSAVNRLKVTDVCASAPSTKGRGEAQRPALFCARARVTGGKRASGTRRTIGFPVKVQHLCVCFFLVAKFIK